MLLLQSTAYLLLLHLVINSFCDVHSLALLKTKRLTSEASVSIARKLATDYAKEKLTVVDNKDQLHEGVEDIKSRNMFGYDCNNPKISERYQIRQTESCEIAIKNL